MTAPVQLNVAWVDANHARISLPGTEPFDAVRTSTGWSTHGNETTDLWSFPEFADLLTFVQERAR